MGDSLTDDLAAAWDAAEENDDYQEESQADYGGSESGEAGLAEPEAEEDGYQSAGPESATAGQESGLDVPKSDAKAKKGDAGTDESPPVGLSPAAREEWKNTPKAVREQFAKREKDFEAGIVKYAQQAKKGDAIDRVIGPFQQYFAMNRQSPPQAIGELLSTAATLQMGSPMQKAQTVAQLVKQFGVDINALDAALVGAKPPAELQEESRVEQLLNERLTPLQQQLQHYQQRDQMVAQRSQQEVHSEIQQFAADPKHEFYNDVKMDMADILDMAANRGVQMSLADAYDRACKLHPEISKIIASRSGGMGRRRNAASSVSGAPAGSGDGMAGADLRSAIEAAWDSAGRA